MNGLALNQNEILLMGGTSNKLFHENILSVNLQNLKINKIGTLQQPRHDFNIFSNG